MGFRQNILPYIRVELQQARAWEAKGEALKAFSHLERAHVLGQSSTIEHVRIHWLMLLWAIRQRKIVEFVGQIVRIVGAATKTLVGLVPSGNTGGSNVSPFTRLPIQPELARAIHGAQSGTSRR